MLTSDEEMDRLRAALKRHKSERPWFDPKSQALKRRYVLWIDVMGARSTMRLTADGAGNSVIKLHDAIVRSCATAEPKGAVNLYPMNDGCFLLVEEKSDLTYLARAVLWRMALHSIFAREPEHRVLVRAGLAYGSVVEAIDLRESCSNSLAERPDYLRSIVVGAPLVHAVETEQVAPPMGVAIHDSARMFAPDATQPFRGAFLRWFVRDGDVGKYELTARAMRLVIEQHYAWLAQRPDEYFYDSGRQTKHLALARQYFLTAELPVCAAPSGESASDGPEASETDVAMTIPAGTE